MEVMNLQKLFQMQKELDNHIENQHPRKAGEDRLAKKVLAFMVEIGELANELPEAFKFWSNKKNKYKEALEEYVDGLHFILSIGLEVEDFHCVPVESITQRTIQEQFIAIYHCAVNIKVCGYRRLFGYFLGLGEMLGFSWEQIEEGYFAKNQINHNRQESGY